MKWRGLKVTHLYNRTSMNAPKSQQKLRDFIHKVDGTVQKIGKESKCSGEADDCVVLPDSIDWRGIFSKSDEILCFFIKDFEFIFRKRTCDRSEVARPLWFLLGICCKWRNGQF